MRLEYPILMDGGLSNVLKDLGCNVTHKLWTAHLLDKDPESIVKAHLKYLEAGAKCIITSSYQASIEGFLENGYSKAQAEELILRSVELAEEAIKRFYKGKKAEKILIAASIGPFGAYLGDGSEYTGKYNVSEKNLWEFHFQRFRILEKSNADIYAFETIPSYRETKILNRLTIDLSKSSWISFSCKDSEHLHDGTHIGECVSLLKGNNKVFAVGINCTDPSYVTGLIKEIRKADSSKKIVIYPNSGERYDAKLKNWTESQKGDQFVNLAQNWINEGADIIGGCCRIGPKQIEQLNKFYFHQNT